MSLSVIDGVTSTLGAVDTVQPPQYEPSLWSRLMPFPARKLTLRGQTRSLKEWCRFFKLSVETVRSRIDVLGWDAEKALTTPADSRFKAVARKPAPAVRMPPTLSRHGSGRAYVQWRQGSNRYTRYFGAWGSVEAAEAYHRFCLEWIAGQSPGVVDPSRMQSVAQICEAFLESIENGTRYRKNGKLTSEIHSQRWVVNLLNRLYGQLDATKFGPDQLEACQLTMAREGIVRTSINHHSWRIKNIFRWAFRREVISAEQYYRLKEVPGLRPLQTPAPEGKPVRPVQVTVIEAVLPHLHPNPAMRDVLGAMVRVHVLLGTRSSELCGMRVPDIDRSRDEWCYVVPPHLNKNAHRNKPQVYWIGPKAQAILRPFIEAADSDPDANGLIFRRPKPKHEGSKYSPLITRDAYCNAIYKACKRAKVPHWFPHQLRHNRATDVATHYRQPAAGAAAIGDTERTAIETYINVDPHEALKRQIARETG